MTPDNGWERWRGEVNSDIENIKEDVEMLFKAKSQHEDRAETIYSRLSVLETKVMMFAMVGSCIGTVAGGVGLWLITRALGDNL